MLWQLLIAASQGFSIRDVGWHNWGLRRNVDFRRNFHDFVILDASAWNCRPPQDPQWTQISTGRASSSPIRASCRFWQARTWHKGSGACYKQYDRRVIPAFIEIIKLLQHPVLQEKAEEMRPFYARTLERSRFLIRTLSVQWTQRVLCSLANLPGTNVPCEVASRHVSPIPRVR